MTTTENFLISNSTSTLPLPAGTWTADPSHTTVGFSVRHLGLSKVRGRFEGVTAQLVVGDDLASSAVTAEIEMASVSTGNTDRDAHLASTDFFGAENNPKMTFVSKEIVGSGDEYKLVGDLTLNGITKPVELDVEFFGTSVFPADQSTRAGFSATGSLSRKEYGIEFNMALGGDKVMISDKVALDLDVQLVAATA
jgi:polyisoprenoid-binding protein YceI